MASKNISITTEVYNQLKNIRNPNESFSEVILRLIAESKKNPMKLFGALNTIPDQEWDLYEKNLEKLKRMNQKKSVEKINLM